MKALDEIANRPRRIVWAVDALTADFELQERTAQVLRALTVGEEARIEPVYLRDAGLARLPAEILLTTPAEVRTAIEKNLGHWLATLGLPGLLPLRVLEHQSTSLRSRVQAFVSYATKAEADFIAVSTNAKRGTDRMLLGSFAETLYLQCELSTVIVSPSCRRTGKISRVLFPTDFEEESAGAFQMAATLSRNLGAGLTVFHKAGLLPPALYQYVSMPSYLNYLDDEVERLELQARDWAESAERMRVPLEIFIEKERGDIASAILRYAEGTSADLIAISPQKGPLGAAVLGSVTRTVVRSSPCPVWIIR